MVNSYETVPEHWKHPLGPYRQAPPEWGGKWWLTSPFHGETPWERFQTPLDAPDLPDGFLEIFGPRPQVRNGLADRAKVVEWEQELKYFKQAGVPEGFDRAALKQATALFEAWAMGRPYFYEGRYGWRAAFPESQVPDFKADPFIVLEFPHLAVAHYQIRLAAAGYEPEKRHPFVPPQIWSDGG